MAKQTKMKKMKYFIALLLILLVPAVFGISYYDTVSLASNQSVCINTHNATGMLKNADSAPSYNVTKGGGFGTSVADGLFINYAIGRYCSNLNVNSSAFVADKLYNYNIFATVDGTNGSYSFGFTTVADGHSPEEVAVNIDDIETDTAAQDTAGEWETLNAVAIEGIQTNATVIINKTNATADISLLQTVANANTQYQNITSNQSSGVSDILTEGSNWVTATGFQTLTNANTQYQNISSNVSLGQTWLYSIGESNWITATGFCTSGDATVIINGISTNRTNITGHIDSAQQNITDTGANDWSGGGATLPQILAGFFNAILQNSSKTMNTTLGENWKYSEGFAGGDATAANQDLILAGIQSNATNITDTGTNDWTTGGAADLTSLAEGVQTNHTKTQEYIHSKYANITSNQSKDVATILGYVDVLPATTPVTWDDTLDVDTLLTNLQTNMNANTTLIVEKIEGINSSILLNVTTTQTEIKDDLALVLLGMVSNNTNVSDGISSVLVEIATAQADLDNPAQYKADVTSLQTIANANAQYQNITSNISSGQVAIITQGDSAWITAVITSLQTITNANKQYQNITINNSAINITKNITDTGTNDWTGGGATLAQIINGIFNAILSNSTKNLNVTIGEIWYNSTVSGSKAGTTDISSLQTIANANAQYTNITINTSQGQTYIISKSDIIIEGVETNRTNTTLGQVWIVDTIPTTTEIDAVIEDEQIITNLGTNFSEIFTNQTALKSVLDDIINGVPTNTSYIVSVISDNTTAVIFNISSTQSEIYGAVDTLESGQTDILTGINSNMSVIQTMLEHATYGLNAIKNAVNTAVTGVQTNTTYLESKLTITNTTTTNIWAYVTNGTLWKDTFRYERTLNLTTTYVENTTSGRLVNQTETYSDGTEVIINWNYPDGTNYTFDNITREGS